MKAERFGRYLLLERIGVGGMAEVFLAVAPDLDRFTGKLVVKRILAARAQSSDFVEMFIAEARIGALLNHPNIAQVYEFGTVNGTHFITMEYLSGRDLAAVCRHLRRQDRACPPAMAAFIACEVAKCLAYAHTLKGPDNEPLDIVHRDISPSNIMCLHSGGVKLLDFGIAKAISRIHGEDTERGLLKGKLAYVAPERIQGGASDGRVDLFGLGVVLWELLAAKRLYHGETELDTLLSIVQTPAVPPSSLRPEVPRELDAIVMRALERDPRERYSTAQAMVDDLEAVLAHMPYHRDELPTLLRELFGADGTANHPTLLAPPPEVLSAYWNDSATEHPSSTTASVPSAGSAPTLAASYLTTDGTSLAPLGALDGRGREEQPTARRVAAFGVFAAVVTLMASMFVERGRTRAPERVVQPAAPTSLAVVEPVGVEELPADPFLHAVAAARPLALEKRSVREGGDESRRAARGVRWKPSATSGRIARGLSIDPFADVSPGGSP